MDRYDELDERTWAMDPMEAFAYLMPLAESGDAAAQCLLADGLDAGIFGPRDSAQSVAWYRKSAAQGYTRAEYFLGSMITAGIGSDPDLNEAAFWFRRAAAKGDAAAQFRLGELLVRNEVQPDPGEDGIQLLELSAAQGFDYAVQLLGQLRRESRHAPR